jgi:hypothetical protein
VCDPGLGDAISQFQGSWFQELVLFKIMRKAFINKGRTGASGVNKYWQCYFISIYGGESAFQ